MVEGTPDAARTRLPGKQKRGRHAATASAADTALPHGGVGFSAYTSAQTIWSLPQSVITVSLVTALLPHRRPACVPRP
jgi:hypothetical protein